MVCKCVFLMFELSGFFFYLYPFIDAINIKHIVYATYYIVSAK